MLFAGLEPTVFSDTNQKSIPEAGLVPYHQHQTET